MGIRASAPRRVRGRDGAGQGCRMVQDGAKLCKEEQRGIQDLYCIFQDNCGS